MPTTCSTAALHGPLAHNERHTTKQDGTDLEWAWLSPRQLLALPILAVVPNRRQTIPAGGRPPWRPTPARPSYYRWLRNEHLRAELDRLTDQAAEFTRSEIESLARRSFTALMEDPDPAVRLRASRAVAAMGIHVYGTDALRRDNQNPQETQGC